MEGDITDITFNPNFIYFDQLKDYVKSKLNIVIDDAGKIIGNEDSYSKEDMVNFIKTVDADFIMRFQTTEGQVTPKPYGM